jgi:putative YhdH/YhfP family quinone oxidoreductase
MENLSFSALVVSEDEHGNHHCSLQQRRLKDLPPGDVLIRVAYSSLNYKDALSATGNTGVTKHYPHTPGIDAAGVIVQSTSSDWREGEEVICTGYDLGMNTDGAFSQYIRVPASWVVRKPEGLSLLQAMQLGTAGFTAGLCLHALQVNAIHPGQGPVLVTGATGGVGSIALMLLHRLGYETAAATGKMGEADYLRSLGASQVIDRRDLLNLEDKPLLPSRWAGVVDTVGGPLLANAIKATGYDGVVTCCGNAASAALPLNVYPFILRGVHLIGIYSANCPMEKRLLIWNKLASEWQLPDLARISRCVSLKGVISEIKAMLAGQVRGRCVVDVEGGA